MTMASHIGMKVSCVVVGLAMTTSSRVVLEVLVMAASYLVGVVMMATPLGLFPRLIRCQILKMRIISP